MKKHLQEIILHVGLHKTGTTTIQETLHKEINNDLLKKRGYLYPTCWESNHSVPVYSAFCDFPERYHINIKRGFDKDKIKKENELNFKKLKQEVLKSRTTKLIISGEDISVLPPRGVSNLREYLTKHFSDKIRVIMYVRNPVSWAISNVQEMIKNGNTYRDSLNGTIHAVKNLLRGRIEKFVNEFGFNSVEIYTFEEAVQHKFGPAGHFLKLLGYNDDEMGYFDFVRGNESISLLSANIISYINEKVPLIKDNKINENRYYGDTHNLHFIRGPKFDIPLEDKERIFENSRSDTEWLKEKYGIDYTDNPVTGNDLYFKFTDESIADIRTAFFKVSTILKGLIVEYLNTHYGHDEKARGLIRDLEGELRIINALEIPNNVEPADIYREVALLLEKHNFIEQAKFMMDKALKLRPHGPFIQQKCKEYEEILSNKGSV